MNRRTTRLISVMIITCMLATCFSGCGGCGKKNETDLKGDNATSVSAVTVAPDSGTDNQKKDDVTEDEVLVKATKDEVINALIADYDFGRTESEFAIEYFNTRINLLDYYLCMEDSLEAYSVYSELKEDADYIRECIAEGKIAINSELDTEALLATCDYIDTYSDMMPYVLREGTSEEYFEESWGGDYNYSRRYSNLLRDAEKSSDDFELFYSAVKMTVEKDYWCYVEYSSMQSIVDKFLAIIDAVENNDGRELPKDYPDGDSAYYERLAVEAYSAMKAYGKAAARAEYAYEKYGDRDFIVAAMKNHYRAGNSAEVLEIARSLLLANADDYEALYYAACAAIIAGNYDSCIEYGGLLADYVSKGSYEQKEADYYLFNLVQKMTVLNDGSFGDNLGFYTGLSNQQKENINKNKLFGTYINAFRGAYDEAFDREKGNPLEEDDLDKSLKYAEELIALLPDCAYPYYIYACLQYRLDDFEKAVTATEYAVKLVPIDSMFYMLLASSYEELAMAEGSSDKAKEYWIMCYRNGVVARDITPWVYNHDKDFYGVGVHSMTIISSGAEYHLAGCYDKPAEILPVDMVSLDNLNKLASKYEELYGINDGYYLFRIAAMMEDPDYGWKDIRAELDKIEDKTSEIYHFLTVEYNVRYEYDSELRRVKSASEAVYDNPLWDYANTLLGVELVAEKHFERAVPYLKKAVSINPDNAYAWAFLGLCYYGETFFGDAQDAFAVAVSLIEDESDPLYEFVSRYTCENTNAARYTGSLPVMENMYRLVFSDMYALYSMLDEYIDDSDLRLLEENFVGTEGGYRYIVKRNANGYASENQLAEALGKSFKPLWVNICYDTNLNNYNGEMAIEDEETPKAPRPNARADGLANSSDNTNQNANGKKDIISGEREAIARGTEIRNVAWTLIGGGSDGIQEVHFGNDQKKAEQERARKENEEKKRQEEAQKEAEKYHNFSSSGQGFDPMKASGYYDDDEWKGDKYQEHVDYYYMTLLMNAYSEKNYKRAVELSRLMLERKKTREARSTINASDLSCKKPNIYIYPEETTEVTFSLGKPGKITASDPLYKDAWTVTAEPDGTLLYDGMKYGYLFYECDVPAYEFKKDRGFAIHADSRVSDFGRVLAEYGFNEQETTDFIEFWADYLDAGRDYLMVPQSIETVERSMPLDISVKVDSITRLWFGFYEIRDTDSVEEPAIIPITRTGFTVVEWGGAVVR